MNLFRPGSPDANSTERHGGNAIDDVLPNGAGGYDGQARLR
jgi:hypothetical protein